MCNLELKTKNTINELLIGKFNKKQIDLTKKIIKMHFCRLTLLHDGRIWPYPLIFPKG